MKLLIIIITLVIFTYYGGSTVPKILKDNKEILLGIVFGLVIGSFSLMEGLDEFPCSSNNDCRNNTTIKQRAKPGGFNINDTRCCSPLWGLPGYSSCGGGPKWNQCGFGMSPMKN
jgi:hypothetical protein